MPMSLPEKVGLVACIVATVVIIYFLVMITVTFPYTPYEVWISGKPL